LIAEIAKTQELADLFGVSQQKVRDLDKRGLVKKLKRNQFDTAESVRMYCAHLRGVASGRGEDEQIVSLADERALLAQAQRRGQEIKNDVAEGKYIEADAVEARWSEILRNVRSGVLACKSRILQRLPHLSREDGEEIENELRDALTALSGND
jgi:phage terminase Nu1 subunit (DNA packaging protein)